MQGTSGRANQKCLGGRINVLGQHKRLQVIKTEGKALERAVAGWIKESLPVEGKALERAVASWI